MQVCQFLRRFLQHVLPNGFQKIRHYGFLSPNSAQSIESLQWLVAAYYDLLYLMLYATIQVGLDASRIRCAECGNTMVLVAFIPPYMDDT